MRKNIVVKRALTNNVSVVYLNMVGGQDEMVFDGRSLAIDKNGKQCLQGSLFTEELLYLDVQKEKDDVLDKLSFQIQF